MTPAPIRVQAHACVRYAEHHPRHATVRAVLDALGRATEVTPEQAFTLCEGNPLHPRYSERACRFFLSDDGRGLFPLKPDSRRPGRWVLPTYLRLPQDPARLAIIRDILGAS